MKVTHVAAGPNFSLVTVNKSHLFSFGKEDKCKFKFCKHYKEI